MADDGPSPRNSYESSGSGAPNGSLSSRSMGPPGATMARPLPTSQASPPLPPPLPGMSMMSTSASAPSSSSSSASMPPMAPGTVPPPPPPPLPPGTQFNMSEQGTSPELTQPSAAQRPLAPQQHMFMQQFMNSMGPRYGSSAPPPPPPAPGMIPSPPPSSNASTASTSTSGNPLLFQYQHPSMIRSATVSNAGNVRPSQTSAPVSPSSRSSAGSPHRAQRPGVRLSGEHVEYTPRREAQEQQTRALEVSPVTIYNWGERPTDLGDLIAVNKQFISYPIRNGLIRVIFQNSVNRILLREHEGSLVTELAFFDFHTNLLLSVGIDHQVLVWQLDPSNTTKRDVWKRVACAAQRAKWHPTDYQRIAVLKRSVVYVVDLTQVDSDGVSEEALGSCSVLCGQQLHSSTLNDVAFSPCGSSLVTAASDGLVHVYRIQDVPTGQRGQFVHRFEPFDGAASVQSVNFFPGNFANQYGLLFGGDGNVKLSLWNAPLDESTMPMCYQTVSIQSSGVHELLMDSSSQFVAVADRASPLLYMFHLALSPNGRTPRRFDNVTEFRLGYPILSMAINNRSYGQQAHQQNSLSESTASLEFLMQLFCLQTQAIQRYNIAATNCYLPFRPVATRSVSEENESVTSLDSFGGGAAHAAQTVGAMTTEEEQNSMSRQAASESPRANIASATMNAMAAPETEIDVQVPGPEDTATSHSRSQSPRNAPHVLTSIQDDGTSSFGGDDGRSYARSSPTSSVRACQDESSVQYEPSLDDVNSEASQQTFLAYLRRIEEAQAQRDSQLKEQMRQMMGSLGNHLTVQVNTQVEKTLQKQIQTVLVPAMGRIVLHTMENNFMKPVQSGFQRVITEKLIPEVEAKLQTSINEVLPDQMDSSVSEMVNKVVEDVRQPVRESFRECFQDIIIPSFQAATQKMFEQINDSFVKGTRTAVEGSTKAINTSQVQNQLKQLTDMIAALNDKVDQLSDGSTERVAGDDNTMNGTAEAHQLEFQKRKVLDAVSAEDFEEAFKLALGAQSVELVAFTCQQCDSRAVLSSRPPRLSQMLILCLVQQLGADLSDDLPLKLAWLRESLLVMNVRDPSISGFVTSVLQELQASLNLVASDERDSQYMLLHHILNSMLSST